MSSFLFRFCLSLVFIVVGLNSIAAQKIVKTKSYDKEQPFIKVGKEQWKVTGLKTGQTTFGTGNHRCGAADPSDNSYFQAVRNGRIGQVRQFLKKGADPNFKDDCGIALIHYVVNFGSMVVLQLLVEGGANVNDREPLFGKTPLFEVLGNIEKVNLLIKNGAEVNLPLNSGESALMEAVELDEPDTVLALLAAGADIDYRVDEDRTAYSFAAEKQNKEIKKILLEAGADATISVMAYKKIHGEDAFFAAAAEGRADIVEAMLAEGTNVNAVNPGKMTALMRTADQITFDLLLAAGADVNLKDNAGFTVLIWSAAFKRNDFVIKLIRAGADVNAETNDGKTVLFFVNDEATRQALIAAGAKEQ